MKKKSDDSGGLILFILFLAFAIAVYLAPIILFAGFLISAIIYNRSSSRIKGNYSDFWLDQEQKNRFKKLSEEINKAKIEIKNSNETANLNNLARNKDESISGRSKLGKELKQIIANNEIILEKIEPEYDVLKELPKRQWNKHFRSYINKNSCIVSLFAYIISSLLLILLFENGWDRFSSFYRSLFDNAYEVDFGLNVIVLVITLLFYIVSVIIFMKKSKNISPKPPDVDDDNVEKY